MSVRFLLQHNEKPSHAFIMCTPWTRLLVETESPSGKGHIIGKEVELRKTTGLLNIITGIEVKQLNAEPTTAQCYLDASAWWLHRAPFGVERLPVKLIANNYIGSLVSVVGWNVTSLQVRKGDVQRLVPLRSLLPLPPNLTELRLSDVEVSDLSPFRDMEILSVSRSDALCDVSGLQGCRHLRVLNVSQTGVQDLSGLAGVLSLEELDCGSTNVTTLAPLTTCHYLKKLNIIMCGSISDLSPLSGLRFLEEINMSATNVTSLAPLALCRNLKKVTCINCQSLTDLSPLSGAPSLEEIHAWWSGVTTIAGLGTCAKLKLVHFDACPSLHDLSGLAGALSLERINAIGSGVTTITGLATCLQLKYVNLDDCASLQDLSPLAGAPSLEEVHADNSGVCKIKHLKRCPKLKTLSLSGTPAEKLTNSGWCVSF